MLSSFASTAPSLTGLGYSPIPIGVAGAHEWNPKGKEPGSLELDRNGEPEWRRLKNWQVFCQRQAHPKTIAYWSSWPNAGVGLACGYGGIVAIDIDDDALVDDILAVLPEVLVAKRGRKGLTAFYRATESLPSKNYRTADRRGLLDFLSAGKQTVLPPTEHPSGGHYEWTTARTLLDTPLAELPIITAANVADMERVLREHGWEATETSQARETLIDQPERASATTSFDNAFDAAATAARAQWLPLLNLHGLHRVTGGWRATASFRASGSGKPIAKRGQSLSIRDSGEIRDFGGTGHNNVTLVAECLHITPAEAFAWLRKQIGWSDAPTAGSAVVAQPTYPDRRVSLDEATARLRDLTGESFAADILAGRAARNLAKVNPPLIHHVHPVTVVRTEAGVGKSTVTREALAEMTRRGMKFVYAAPNHELTNELARDFAAIGINAEVYRGYEQPDPLSPDHQMCRNRPAYKAARNLSIGIRAAVCERRIDNKIVRCPVATTCGMERQREARPSVFIIPSALLFSKRPDFFFEPDAIVIDESFIGYALEKKQEIDVSALLESKIVGCDADEYDAVERYRHRLFDAIRANGDGPLKREVLLKSEISAEEANWIGWLEQRGIKSSILRPNMPPSEIKATVERHSSANKFARAAGTLWQEIAIFLWEGDGAYFMGDRSLSGRIAVNGSKVSVRPLRTVHTDWREAPLLYLDATPPPAPLVAITLGEVEVPGGMPVVAEQPEIAARWSEHVRVRQILGAPITMDKVGVGSWARKKAERKQLKPEEQLKPRNVSAIVRFIRLRAALAAPGRIGVITYKELRERLVSQLPDNVEWMHFGKLVGLNSMQDVAGLIVIGRLAAPKAAVEADASIYAGRPISGGEGHYFSGPPGGIRLADGSAVKVDLDRHPEPIAEAVRWGITERELLQAVGRLRPHRRNEPCWLDIICDVALPITVHEVVQWKDVAPGVEADMAGAGVILTNSRDAMDAFDLSKHGAEKVGGCPDFSNRELSIRDSGATSPVLRFTYRKKGPGQKVNEGYYLPGVLPGGEAALRGWLERRLGLLSQLFVDTG